LASFVFFYRSEHQLNKMGLIKSATRWIPVNIPPKPTTNRPLPQGSNMFQDRSASFGQFRDGTKIASKGEVNNLTGPSDDNCPLVMEEHGTYLLDIEMQGMDAL
jgi:hypothetical protein